MRKIFKTVAALAVVMFAGCTNDLTNEVVAPVGDKTTVTVGIADTKTYLGELVNGARKVYWSEGDQIAINGVASNKTILSEDKTYATFEFSSFTLSRPYSILYPASAYVDASTITLPAVQEYAEGTFATNCAPMACYAEEGAPLALHHLASVVRLQVKLPAESEHASHNLVKVEFRGKAGEQVSGNFAIDYAEATLTATATSTAEADKVVATKVDKALSTEPTDIFVVVPARIYEQGFTVRLIDEAGHFMDIATNAITLTKGDIKAMPEFNFAPTGTLAGVQISSAEEWNTFVAAYNNGNYAEEEGLAVILTNDLVFDETTTANFAEINEFKHTLDGGNFSIKGLKDCDKALVTKMAAGAVIKNLHIDSSSNFKFTTKVQMNAIFVRENNGTIQKCINNAKLDIVGNESASERNIGALVGKNMGTGLIDDCTNNGAITIASDVKIENKTLLVGGIVGRNAGTTQNSTNNGNLTINADNTGANYNGIAGIAGMNEGSTIGCINGAYATITGTLKATKHYVGGIVGLNRGTCEQNTNNGTIDYSPTGISATNWSTCGVGGIVGIQESVKANSNTNTNTGNITSATDAQVGGVGGVAGIIVAGELKHNNVTESAKMSSSANCSKGMGVGGLIGHTLDFVGTLDLSGDEGTIRGNVVGTKLNGSSGVGGLIGLIYKNATVKNVTNCSCVVTLYNNTQYLAAGGIVGRADIAAAIGTTEISGCTYKGNITVAGTSSLESFAGGIIGHVNGKCTLNVEDCKYYGNIVINTTKAYFGGMVACDQNGGSITDCSCGGVFNGITINSDALAKQYVSRGGKGLNVSSLSTLTNITYWDGN